MSLDVAALPEPLRLERVAPGSFAAPPALDKAERNVVFGGQLLAQAITAVGIAVDATKDVQTIHIVYVRPGDASTPLRYDVEVLSAGRTFASSTVTVTQGDRIVARASVLQSADEPDFIRHGHAVMPDVAAPTHGATAPRFGMMFPGATSEVADDAGGFENLDAAHAPSVNLWMHYAAVPPSPLVAQAILAWGTNGVLGSLALRHHEGLSEQGAHRLFSGAPLTHTVSFLERFDLTRSVLLALEATWAGRARMHGRANVFDRDGALIATFSQDGMARPFPDGKDHRRDFRWIM